MSRLPPELQDILRVIRPSRFVPLILLSMFVIWLVLVTNASDFATTVAIGGLAGLVAGTLIGGAFLDVARREREHGREAKRH
jgi:preprotein translocase subunit SecF